MKSFRSKVAVVTGAGSGIGRALTVRLAAEGARVAASDIDADGLEETVRLAGDGARGYALDVADRDAVYAHASQVAADFGAVNLVINNAGVAMKGTIREMSDEDLKWVMDIDFWGVVHGTRAFLPHVIESGDGHVVNLSSVFGLIAVPTQAAYNAAKFAVRGFTEALRQEMELDKLPVGVSCVHPGGVKTNIARNARSTDSADKPDDMGRRFEQIARTTPDAAARTILAGVRRNRARILIGPDAYVIDALPRVFGSYYQEIVKRGGRSLLK
jgi:NAD(P)-dependent dehydrogenase (short-subunit alcohol dehydrogenase family)